MSGSTLTLDEGALDREEAKLAAGGFAALGDMALDIARAETPVDTGELLASLYVQVYHDGRLVHGSGGRPEGVVGQGIEVFVGTSGTDYARFVHDGTSDTRAYPFLATAFAAIRARAAGIIGGG